MARFDDILRNISKLKQKLAFKGGARNFPIGADFTDEGAKIWFSGY